MFFLIYPKRITEVSYRVNLGNIKTSFCFFEKNKKLIKLKIIIETCVFIQNYILKKKKKSKSEGCFSIWAKIKIKRIEMGFFHSTSHTVASVSFRVITKLQTFGCLHIAKFDILLPDKNNFHLPISVIFFFFLNFFFIYGNVYFAFV